MARAVDKLIAHYARTKGVRKHKLFDLGHGESLDLWWSPWTLGEMDRVFEGAVPSSPVPTPVQAARIVAVKAEDADGKRLFKGDVEETELLNEADPTLVMKMALAIRANWDADTQAAIPDPMPGEAQEPGPKA
jgi:hypothetical protein